MLVPFLSLIMHLHRKEATIQKFIFYFHDTKTKEAHRPCQKESGISTIKFHFILKDRYQIRIVSQKVLSLRVPYSCHYAEENMLLRYIYPIKILQTHHTPF